MDKNQSALRAIYKYNFQEDVGKYYDHAKIKNVRFYALPGEPGTVICSFPNGGAESAAGKIKNDWEYLTVGYFSESMTGFTYEAASHMIAEGMVDEGMKMIEAIHSRYDPIKRNPYNEIEYGNHYIRAMASYGAFISASGFTYHGPKGEIGFNPKINPLDFKSAFTAAEAWGSFSQKVSNSTQVNNLTIKYGKLKLNTINLKAAENLKVVEMTINNKPVDSTIKRKKEFVSIKFNEQFLTEDDQIKIVFQ